MRQPIHPLILEEGKLCKHSQRRRQVSDFDEEAITQLLAYRGKIFPRPLQ